MNRDAPVAQLDRALPSEGKGHTFESCRVRHFVAAKASLAYAPSGRVFRCHPGSPRLPPKISKTTPCKVAVGRRNRRLEPILDRSGKSAALLHHRKIR